MKKLTTFVFAALGALVLTGCKPAVKDTFTVTFDSHGGSAVAEMKDVKVVETEPVTTLARHEFKGWYEDAEYTGNRLTFPYNVTKDITLHAKWNELKYTVTFETNEGSAVAPMNVSIIETEPVTSRNGYSFDGWFTSMDSTSRVTFPYVVDHAQTLYAKWTLITYLVTFDADGGSPVATQDTVLIETEPATSRTGYNFLGWFASDTATDPVTFPYTVDHAQTLHARWERDKSIPLMDGVADEDIWSTSVMDKAESIYLNENYFVTIYATKQEAGIYIYAEQYVANLKSHATEWWNNNNIEFRFGNEIVIPDTGVEHQYVLSDMSGGFANHGTIGVVNGQMSGNLHLVLFELFIPWNQLEVTYDNNILFSAGSNMAGGWAATASWGRIRADKLDDYKVITADGIVPFAGLGENFFERTGTELLAEPVHRVRADGYTWDSHFVDIRLDGTESWELRVDMHSNNAEQPYNDCGWCGEVYSPNWTSGGWTFRQDWWGWGGWSQGGTDHNAGPHGDFVDCPDGDGIYPAMKDKEVTVFVEFNATLSRIAVRGVYTSTTTGYEDGQVFIAYTSDIFNYRGEMIASFGFCNGDVTVKSVQLISGSLAA